MKLKETREEEREDGIGGRGGPDEGAGCCSRRDKPGSERLFPREILEKQRAARVQDSKETKLLDYGNVSDMNLRKSCFGLCVSTGDNAPILEVGVKLSNGNA